MLDGIGLTDGEERIYLTLLDRDTVTAAELAAAHPGIDVARVLDRLEGKALVARRGGQPVRYQAAPPDVALEVLVRGREQQLQRTRLGIAALSERYRTARVARPDEVVEVVTGRDATVQRWEQLQRSARTQVRSFDRPPYVTNPSANPIELDLLHAGVGYRSVYHPAGFALPSRTAYLRGLIAAGEQARVAVDVPVKLFIADDRLGLLPLEVSGSAESCLVIRASSLLETLIALFEHVWRTAVPVHPDGSLPDVEGRPTGDDQALLTLLAGGLTDAAIARQLGSHPRTIQRRVRDLLDRLGAGTRFQAGMQAVRRGWL